jgi:error-prone DNA polymerase
MAMAVSGFTGGEAEELRRAMGFKRSLQRMQPIEARLREGMRRNGIDEKTQDAIVQQIVSFALYGFPESHAASFALIAYASAYLRTYHGAAFVAALLNNQPMGFYHPATLVKDAQRHGVHFRPVDVTRSEWLCALEGGEVRLGLLYAKGLRKQAGEKVVAARREAPFASLQDFVDRSGLHKDELPRLAEIGALNAFGLTRRSALWQVERASRPRGPLFERLPEKEEPSPLAEMSFTERMTTDIAGTGLTVGPHPMVLHRDALQARGVLRAADVPRLPDGVPVTVAGAVICRQRPGTAKGFMFLTLEDETGLVNVIVRPDLYEREKTVLVGTGTLEVSGVLQNSSGTTVRATGVRPLGPALVASRDFR